LAAAGYAGFSLAMACGRLVGSSLVVQHGEEKILVGGALLAAAGMVLAAWAGSVTIALVGFVLVGLGLANVFPLAIARAGALGGAGGVALASTVGYTGRLGGPPLLGFLAEATGLSLALTTVSVFAVVAALLVRSLAGDPVSARPPAGPGLPRPPSAGRRSPPPPFRRPRPWCLGRAPACSRSAAAPAPTSGVPWRTCAS